MMLRFFKRFHNPPGAPQRNYNIIKWLRFIARRFSNKKVEIPIDFIIPPEKALENYHHLVHENTLTWLGHSTMLIKLNGKTILTDPFLTDYASPFKNFGPKRYSPPGLHIQDLPAIDILLISHDHFDHLDAKTLIQLPNKLTTEVIVPLGLSPFIKKLGFTRIHELDWHQSWKGSGISIRALPAYHYSKRNLFLRNTTLWASYSIQCDQKKLYFSGDTAYGSIFLDLGRDYGPFDYALLSIGAYNPPELMLQSHLSPELAVIVGKELRAHTLVAMHWGTIVLSDENPFEPPKRFLKATMAAGYNQSSTWILKIGETRKI